MPDRRGLARPTTLRCAALFALLVAFVVCPSPPAGADDPPKAAADKVSDPLTLRELFKDDFQTDTRKDYAIKGDVAWERGTLMLSAESSVTRKIEAGPHVEVELDLDWPELAKDGDQSITLLGFKMNGATDCYVGWFRSREKEQTTERVRILDTAVNEGKTQLLRVRDFVASEGNGTWRVAYRYGGFAIRRGETDVGWGHIENSAANPRAVTLAQSAGSCRVHVAGLLATPAAKPLSGDDQKLVAEAESLNGAVVKLYREGKFNDAIPRAERIAEIRRGVLGANHADYATSLNNLAELYRSMGAYAKPEPLYAQARDIRKRVLGEEHSDYALSLNNLAALYYSMGAYAKAEPLYVQARDIWKRALGDEHPNYAASLNNLAELYRSMGADAKAEPLYVEARDIWKRAVGEEHPYYAASLNNLAGLYKSMGAHEKAEPLYVQARDIRKRVLGEEHPDYAASLNNLAGLYQSMGAYAKAEPLYVRTRDILKRLLGEEHSNYAGSLNNLGILYQSMGTFAKAEPLYVQARDIRKRLLGEEHPDYAVSLHSLAGLYDSIGDSAKAESSFRAALTAKLAFVELTSGGLAESRTSELAAETVTCLDPLLSAARNVAGSSPRVVYDDVWKARGLLTRLVRDRKRDVADDPGAAASWSELRSVQQQLASWTLLVPNANQREMRSRRLAELNADKERLEADLAARSAAYRRTREIEQLPVSRLMDALPDETALVHLLAVWVWDRKPDGKGLADPVRHYEAFVLTRAARQSQDQPGYDVAWVHLGAADPIDRAVSSWRNDLQSGNARGAAEPRDVLDSAGPASGPALLREYVWEKIEPHLGGRKTVILIPDGDLHFVPWGALPGKKPGTYLVEEYSLVSAIDGPQLYATLTDPAIPGESQAVLIGGVDYDADLRLPVAPAPAIVASTDSKEALALDDRTRGPSIDGSRPAWKPLAGTAKEIEQIAGLAGKSRKMRPLSRADATEKSLREVMPGSRFLHLATHGFFADEQFRSQFQHDEAGEQLFGGAKDLVTRKQAGVTYRNPLLLSGIVLAGANRPPQIDSLGLETGQDGILTAEEVVNLDLRKTELVVLSACETGLGRVGGGEGVFGLQRAFTLAGARTTIASLWKVDDAATQALMAEFYRNLWDKKFGKLESLRQAQIAMIRRYVPQQGALRALDPNETVTTKPATPNSKATGRATPFHWAAFTLSGDWR